MDARSLISRRGFLKSIAVAGAGVILTACGSAQTAGGGGQTSTNSSTPSGGKSSATAPPSGTGKSGQVVHIDVWSGWTEEAAKKIQSLLDEYNKSQNQVVAKHVIVPDDMSQKLLAAITAGNPPAAAIVFGSGLAYQLAARDALLSMEDIGSQSQLSALKKWMSPALYNLGKYNGKLYFAPIWSQCWGVFVNTNIAKKQGVDAGSPPQTLEDLDKVWEKLTSYDSKGNIKVLGGDTTSLEMMMGRYLGKFVSDDGSKITANDPNNLKALEWIDNRWEKMGRQKVQRFYASLQGRGGRSASQDPFLSGLIATNVTGPWEFDTIINFKPKGFEYTVWPLPGPAGQSKKGMYTYGDGWVVPKGSKAPKAALDIISAMTGASGDRDLYTSLFTTWQCVNGPNSEQILDYSKFKQDVSGKCPGYQDIFLQDLLHSDYYLYPPKIPTSLSYTTLLDSEAEKVRYGKKKPKEALDYVTQKAQQDLDTWRSQNGQS